MKFYFLVLVLLLVGRFLHDFHASLSEVKLNSKEQVYEVSLRVFTDDLEAALGLQSASKFKLNSNPDMEPALTQYLSRNWVMKINGKSLQAKYLGKEFDQDVCYLFFEYPYDKVEGKIEIRNTVLVELFEDQTNLLNFYKAGSRKTLVYDRNLKEAALD